MVMPIEPHCASCAAHPQAYRLGYVEALEGPIIDDIYASPDAPAEDDDDGGWALAYWHGRYSGRQVRETQA